MNIFIEKKIMSGHKKETTAFDHVKAIIALPFMVLVVVPFLIQRSGGIKSTELFSKLIIPFPLVAGCVLLLVGLFLFATAVILFCKSRERDFGALGPN